MRASQLISTLALTATTALAGRSTQHVGNFAKRLERAGRSPPVVEPPVMKRDHQGHTKRANTTTQFLTNATASKPYFTHKFCNDVVPVVFFFFLSPEPGADILHCACARLIEFSVDGTAVPEVDFDLGESYAGSIPVTTDEAGDYLFFWFFPSTNEAADKEILIWLNGGVRHQPHSTNSLSINGKIY